MGEREMLELAARAAGIALAGDGVNGIFYDALMGCVDADSDRHWNPLEDDGDALRLAVRLNMDVDIGRRVISVAWFDAEGNVFELKEPGEKSGAEPFSATRRAITRAAAEIGKAIAPGAEK
ncbi:MAG: hypothetical protein V4858_16995 [Pseudomonadota bacterium]